MIWVDGIYSINEDDDGNDGDTFTRELKSLDWPKVYEAITEIFDWEASQHGHVYVECVEIWEEDVDDYLYHYSREEAIALSNNMIKNCKSIW